MKNLLLHISSAAILILGGCITGKPNATRGVVYINDLRTKGLPGPDLPKYHHHDVDAFRVNEQGNSTYWVYYYRNINDTLRCFRAAWEEKEDLDRVAYKWVNDSMVSVRLYSTTSKKELKYKVFGNIRNGKKLSGITFDN